MTDGGAVGKVGILRLLRGLVILQSVAIKFRLFGPPARGRFVVRVRWAHELIDMSLTLRDLGCAHSLTIATPLSGRSPPFTRAAEGGHP